MHNTTLVLCVFYHWHAKNVQGCAEWKENTTNKSKSQTKDKKDKKTNNSKTNKNKKKLALTRNQIQGIIVMQ